MTAEAQAKLASNLEPRNVQQTLIKASCFLPSYMGTIDGVVAPRDRPFGGERD